MRKVDRYLTRAEYLKRHQELTSRIARRKAQVAEAESKRKNYEETHKIEFFDPFPHQQRVLVFLQAGKKTVLLQGANSGGKTVLGACVTGAQCLGIQPWDMQPSLFGDIAVRTRIICEDWEHHAKEVIIPKLKEWLPAGSYRTKNNNVGIEGFWMFSNGSTIEIMTNTQETRLHEGWNGHFVWADEPPSRDKYVANKRGLIDFSGVFLLTMTATKETWVLDDIALNPDPSFASVTGIPMRANPTLKEDDIASYEAALTEDEKISRIQGGWLNLIGLVWKNFKPEVHIIDNFKVPMDWPFVAMIDFHTEKPHAVSYYCTDPNGNWYLADETFLHESPEGVAEGICRRKRDNKWRLNHAFIDPLAKGDTKYVKMRGIQVEDSYNILERALSKHQILLNVASKDKQSGILNVEKMLCGPNGLASLYFFRNTVNNISYNGHGEGTVWEIQRWVYRDGEPIKENDHFCENLYRLSLTGIKYSDPRAFKFLEKPDTYNPLLDGLGVRL